MALKRKQENQIQQGTSVGGSPGGPANALGGRDCEEPFLTESDWMTHLMLLAPDQESSSSGYTSLNAFSIGASPEENYRDEDLHPSVSSPSEMMTCLGIDQSMPRGEEYDSAGFSISSKKSSVQRPLSFAADSRDIFETMSLGLAHSQDGGCPSRQWNPLDLPATPCSSDRHDSFTPDVHHSKPLSTITGAMVVDEQQNTVIHSTKPSASLVEGSNQAPTSQTTLILDNPGHETMTSMLEILFKTQTKATIMINR
ncbi:MAG: hypothetical protein M1827_006611 [Pycnora praestabilis]|nr:MAG: hypothetical protein M1827_006611 [Pycnora praestabilis]